MRRLILAALWGVLCVSAGCRMCANCFDYCGPVNADPAGYCDPDYRYNSILGDPVYGYDEAIYEDGDVIYSDGYPMDGETIQSEPMDSQPMDLQPTPAPQAPMPQPRMPNPGVSVPHSDIQPMPSGQSARYYRNGPHVIRQR